MRYASSIRKTRPRRRAAMERHFAGETPIYEGEWRVRPIGGEYRWVQTRGLCVRDAAGRPIRMVGSVTDIDERKRIEAALRQSEERYAWRWRRPAKGTSTEPRDGRTLHSRRG